MYKYLIISLRNDIFSLGTSQKNKIDPYQHKLVLTVKFKLKFFLTSLLEHLLGPQVSVSISIYFNLLIFIYSLVHFIQNSWDHGNLLSKGVPMKIIWNREHFYSRSHCNRYWIPTSVELSLIKLMSFV